MKNFIKRDWFKVGILVIFIVIIGGSFYWYGYRPSKIRHDCSWVPGHSDAIALLTQAQHDKCIINCSNNSWPDLCRSWCAQPHTAQPAKDWWAPAIKTQYDFCIHEKGL